MFQKVRGLVDNLNQPIAKSKQQQQQNPPHILPLKVEYTSKDIEIADTFLTGPPAKPITSHPIDFASSALPHYKDHTAIVLENVLSPDECHELVRLAEASVPDDGGDGSDPWKPALVNVGPGLEISMPGYRDSSRIIWDQQAIVNRLWERCALSTGLRELLATCPGQAYEGQGQWVFSRFNDRMRFLKYSKGQYFKPHTDGPYFYAADGKQFRTFYTVHLYLNDSFEVNPTSELVGGATSFLSRDKSKRVDVNPKAGSVLIFQHKGLYHEGAIVSEGLKFTVRTDILYQWVPTPKNE